MKLRTTFAVCFITFGAITISSCDDTSASVRDRPPRDTEIKITGTSRLQPNRLRFEVDSTPYSPEDTIVVSPGKDVFWTVANDSILSVDTIILKTPTQNHGRPTKDIFGTGKPHHLRDRKHWQGTVHGHAGEVYDYNIHFASTFSNGLICDPVIAIRPTFSSHGLSPFIYYLLVIAFSGIMGMTWRRK